MIYDVDFSSIEARGVCWLAGQQDALDEYAAGVDRYILMAQRIYGCPPQQVDSDRRFLGKQSVLGCGYQMGPPRFQEMCAVYDKKIPLAMCKAAVKTYRDTHPKVVNMWSDTNEAAMEAIRTQGGIHPVGSHIAFEYCKNQVGNMSYLYMHLPSGRKIAYPDPKISRVKKDWGDGNTSVSDQITFAGQIPNSVRWGRISTYGGKLTENATQGTAACLMANACRNAEEDGFEIFAIIHDQALAPASNKKHLQLKNFEAAMIRPPKWAKGLPLAADGKTTPYYTK